MKPPLIKTEADQSLELLSGAQLQTSETGVDEVEIFESNLKQSNMENEPRLGHSVPVGEKLNSNSHHYETIVSRRQHSGHMGVLVKFISVAALIQSVVNFAAYGKLNGVATRNYSGDRDMFAIGANVALAQGIALLVLAGLAVITSTIIASSTKQHGELEGGHRTTTKVEADTTDSLKLNNKGHANLRIRTSACELSRVDSTQQESNLQLPCTEARILTLNMFPMCKLRSLQQQGTLDMFCLALVWVLVGLSGQVPVQDGDVVKFSLSGGGQVGFLASLALFSTYTCLNVPAWARYFAVLALWLAGIAYSGQESKERTVYDIATSVVLFTTSFTGFVLLIQQFSLIDLDTGMKYSELSEKSGSASNIPTPCLQLKPSFAEKQNEGLANEGLADGPRQRSATMQLEQVLQTLESKKHEFSSTTCIELSRILQHVTGPDIQSSRQRMMRQRSWMTGMTLTRRRMSFTSSMELLHPEHAKLLGVFVRPVEAWNTIPSKETAMHRPIRPSVDARVPPQNDQLLEYMQNWDFGPGGIFQRLLDAESGKLDQSFSVNPLAVTVIHALRELDCFAQLEVSDSAVYNFLEELEKHYLPVSKVAYHNAIHATDVTQSVYVLLRTCRDQWTPLELFAAIISAAGHDVAHPGLNNNFQVRTSSVLAIRYNDSSVLENFHVATLFEILNSLGDNSPVAVFDEATRLSFRAQVLDMILATDLASHFEHLHHLNEYFANRSSLKAMHSSPTVNGMKSGKDPSSDYRLCSMLLHFADVGSVSKHWEIYKQWIEMLFKEFHAQGDVEHTLGLEVAEFMDRRCNDSPPPTAQISFIDVVVSPLHRGLRPYAPGLFDKLGETISKNIAELHKWDDQLNLSRDEVEEDVITL